jgi:hypothetical protein
MKISLAPKKESRKTKTTNNQNEKNKRHKKKCWPQSHGIT